MIDARELRLNNLVYWDNDTYSDRENKVGKNIFKVVLIAEDLIKIDIGFGAVQRFEKEPIISPKIEELQPIPISEEWLLKLSGIKYPKWIKYVHTLQNWYWVNNKCKKELLFK